MKSFIHRFATPLTLGLFTVSMVSGVALFFHWSSRTFHSMHEWLSMLLLIPFVLHVWKNWSPIVGYLRRGTLIWPVAACLIIAVPFAVHSLQGTGRGGNPMFRAGRLLLDAPLADVAPLLQTTPEALRSHLATRGYTVAAASDSLNAVASASGKSPMAVLADALPQTQSSGTRRRHPAKH